MIHVPGHFLPFEEIQLPPHLMPVNPEDEDDVVPDMHAAFGIQRALGGEQTASHQQGVGVEMGTGERSGRGAQQEPIWRDLGMERLMYANGVGADKKGVGDGTVAGARREGKKTGILLLR